MTTQPPNPEVVEAARRYVATDHRMQSVSKSDSDLIWPHVPESHKSVGAALSYGVNRILAAEVERLRAKEDGGCASEWRLSKGAEENPSDGTIVGECSGGQFVVFAPSKIPIYCPGCGRKVKIQPQTDEQP